MRPKTSYGWINSAALEMSTWWKIGKNNEDR